VLGNDDPAVKNLQDVLADKNASAGAVWYAQNQAENQRQLQSGAAKERAERNAADPLYKLETDPTEMQGDKSTSALALLNNRASTEKDPVQLARVNRLITQANAAHLGFLADKQAEENAKQLAVQGDPNDAGQQLFNGTLTLADMKSRGLTPKFILDASKAAENLAASKGQKYNPSDEIVGESVLKQAGSQAFFGSANSLLGPTGTLKQLETAGQKIPQSQFPAANTVEDWIKIQAGGGAPGGYAATLLGVADDYGKVMGGGSASDSARLSAEFLAKMSASPESRAAALAGVQHSVESQLEARIGSNRYLRQREGYNLPTAPAATQYVRPAGVSAQAILMAAPGGQPHWIEPQNQDAAKKVGAVQVQ
jgi:hypothetical protein